MTVTPSTLIPKNTAVAVSGKDLWEPTAIFLPDWSDQLRLATSWRTTVQEARSGAEQRFGKVNKPYRSQRLRLRSFGDANTQKMRATLQRLGRSRSPWPVFPDVAQLTGRDAPTNFIYNMVDGDYRRFQVGARAVAVLDNQNAIAEDFVFRTITAVTPTQITLDGDLKEYDSPPTIVDSTHEYSAAYTGAVQTTTPVTATGGDLIIVIAAAEADSISNGFQPTSINYSTGGLFGNATRIIRENPNTPDGRELILDVSYFVVPSGVKSADVVASFPNVCNTAGDANASAMVIRNADPNNPIFHSDSAQGTDVTPSPFDRLTAPDLNVQMQNNALLGLFLAGVSSTGPGNALLYSGTGLHSSIRDESQYGLSFDLAAEGFNDPTSLYASLTSAASSTDEGFTAGAICIQQKLVDRPMSAGQIYPVMECDVEVANAAQVLTDNVNEVIIDVLETPGPSALDPIIAPGTTPSGFVEYNGYPIMHLPINWNAVQMGTFRLGKRESVGITNTFTAFGTQPGETFSLPFLVDGRADIWKLLEFFDSRGGRLHPFWLISPSSGLQVTEIGAGADTLRLNANTTERDWEVYKQIGVMNRATGVLSVHTITLSEEEDDEHVLTITPALSSEVVSDWAFATAHLCRFNTEEIGESWLTDEVLEVSLPCRELLEEKTVALELMDHCTYVPGPPWEPDDEYDLCVSRCGQEVGGCCMCADGGVTMELFCWYTECCDDDNMVGCGNECLLFGNCAHQLSFVSCVGGVMRWEGPSLTWATLDTSSESWNHDVGTSYADGCCAGFTGPTSPLICAQGDCCEGEANCEFGDFLTEEACESFVLKSACTRYASDGQCRYVTIVRITPIGGGPGSSNCA